ARAAREIARVLEPRGTLVLSAPAFGALAGAHDVAVGALRRYTAPGLRRLLERAGLAVRRTSYANCFLAAPIWLFRKVTGARAYGRPREDARSDFGVTPSSFEGIFFSLLSLEARILPRARLPFGVTVLALAEKPDQGTSEAGK
ncbi:MAG: class I SAM-dependent methyltransferase, partial [Thermoanaerobaculia bacterium]